MLNTVVFASGNGTNFQAIIDAVDQGELKLKIKLLVCDKEDAYAIERALNNKIDVLLIDYKKYSKSEIEHMLVHVLKEKKIELVVLAGFLRIFSPYFISNYRNKIINIHPSLLPKYKGLHAVEQALEQGEQEIGVTVHYVDEKLDSGDIILQDKFKITGLNETAIYENLHELEHRLYIEALKKITEEV